MLFVDFVYVKTHAPLLEFLVHWRPVYSLETGKAILRLVNFLG